MTYKDYNISSSIELHRLQTEQDFADCVDLAINALMESARNAEHLSVDDWNPDTLRLNDHGITLYEALNPEAARSIDYQNIPQALKVANTST